MLSLPDLVLDSILDYLPGHDLERLKYVCRNLRNRSENILKNRCSECIAIFRLDQVIYRRGLSGSYFRKNDYECKDISVIRGWNSSLRECLDKGDVVKLIKDYLLPNVRCLATCGLVFISRSKLSKKKSRNYSLPDSNGCPLLIAETSFISFLPKQPFDYQPSIYLRDFKISAFFPSSHFASFKIIITDIESSNYIEELDYQEPLKCLLLFYRRNFGAIKLSHFVSNYVMKSNPIVGGAVYEKLAFRPMLSNKVQNSNVIAVYFLGSGIRVASLIIKSNSKDCRKSLQEFKSSLNFDPNRRDKQEYTIGFLNVSSTDQIDQLYNILCELFPKTYIFVNSSFLGKPIITGISMFPHNLRRCRIHNFVYCKRQFILINFKKD